MVVSGNGHRGTAVRAWDQHLHSRKGCCKNNSLPNAMAMWLEVSPPGLPGNLYSLVCVINWASPMMLVKYLARVCSGAAEATRQSTQFVGMLMANSRHVFCIYGFWLLPLLGGVNKWAHELIMHSKIDLAILQVCIHAHIQVSWYDTAMQPRNIHDQVNPSALQASALHARCNTISCMRN